jgi:long-subunit acyl-CoA synthetase (AMP-forming)
LIILKGNNMTDQIQSCIQGFYHWETELADKVYLKEQGKDGWDTYTWKEAGAQARCIGAAIQELTAGPQSKVAILSNNSAHWVMSDLAIQMADRISIPIFTTMTADIAKYVLELTETEVLLLGHSVNWEEIKAIVPDSVKIITFPGVTESRAHCSWESVIESYKPIEGTPAPAEDHIATIGFTSGTTGQPKGIMHSHKSAYNVIDGVRTTLGFGNDEAFFSYLPLAHLAERFLIAMDSMVIGAPITFCASQETFAQDLNEASPTMFFAVPRLWKKFQLSILEKMGGEDKLNEMLANPEMADAVRGKIRAALGWQNTKIMVTGAAATSKAMHEWYESLGLPLMDIYGQSEVVPLTMNRAGVRKVGTLGKPIEGADVKISEAGEVLGRGKGQMVGYLKLEEKTSETVVDGWVHTGDKGYLDDDGFLVLTGRVKDIFKTAKGKYVAPAPIEDKLSQATFIEQLCVTGNGLPQTALIIVLSEDGASLSKENLEERIIKLVNDVNQTLPGHEKMGSVIVDKTPWTIENSILTHTMKVKRDKVDENYQDALAKCDVESKEILIQYV